MDRSLLERQFARMGARLKVRGRGSGVRLPQFTFGVDVRRDRRGPFFEIRLGTDVAWELEVVDLQPRQRHLLLLVRQPGDRGEGKHKFLCGHDERHWFAAAVPNRLGASTVGTAIEALKPDLVREAQARKRLKARYRNRRHNRAFLRQGEWFFIPAPELVVDPSLVLRNEPLIRGGGKPHRAEFAYRTGGETVYVSREHPRGLTEREYKSLRSRSSRARKMSWTVMRRNARVYVRGKIRHADHKTLKLNDWHRVMPNTESQAASRHHLMFLD